jgi:hypothetical protein
MQNVSANLKRTEEKAPITVSGLSKWGQFDSSEPFWKEWDGIILQSSTFQALIDNTEYPHIMEGLCSWKYICSMKFYNANHVFLLILVL